MGTTGPAGEPARVAVPERAPRARLARRLLALALALLAGALLLEVVLRLILFADWFDESALARRFRREELYASQSSEDYWKLDILFRREHFTSRRHPTFDAYTGWRSEEIDPATLAHADEARLGARRPVLLFGDSYAQCVDRAGACWEDLLEASELSDRFALLNYGVGGYGLDQATLLCRRVLERFRERDPLVVIAILVDDDLDRCFLRLRGHPKPWFTLEDGALAVHPPVAETPLAFVRAEPPGVSSYVWRGLLFGSGRVERATAERWTASVAPLAEREALCRAILADLAGELSRRKVDFFFLLFHGRGAAIAPGPAGWQEPFLYRALEELRAPFVSSKRWLRARATSPGLEEFYFTEGAGSGHFNAPGNHVVFEALRGGLLGEFEPYEYLAER